MSATFTCSICGHRSQVPASGDLRPAGQQACAACPLVKGCHMVCCPACGSSHIDPSRSTLVRWITKLTGEKKHGITANH